MISGIRAIDDRGGVAAPAAKAAVSRHWLVLCLGLVALVLAPPLLVGFQSPFWRYADSDLFFSYQAILLNQGLPQDYFDHPGYTEFVFLGGWYRVLHGLGLIGLDRFGELPPASDRAGFEHAWQDLVMAGRAAAMLLSAVLVVGFASAIRRRPWPAWRWPSASASPPRNGRSAMS